MKVRTLAANQITWIRYYLLVTILHNRRLYVIRVEDWHPVFIRYLRIYVHVVHNYVSADVGG